MDPLGEEIHTEEIIPQSGGYVFRNLTPTEKRHVPFWWSVMTKTSKAVQRSMHTSSIGSDVEMDSRDARAAGSMVLPTIHLSHRRTWFMMSVSMPAQKNISLARERVRARP